ncbi:MAG: adenylate/guanylate cyclase domain-containing protein [Magnetococcales bacterium]|nr:adenylate/guanylate cyclase domain-containing protein [Magnetococcales bacterium]NGZ07502.1 adenylate/guanylate cyclase domain-containing protein [Magnetococcales bacterium]
MRENAKLAILFADIAGSTKLYETIGDAKAREITSRCIELLATITKSHEGRVVKTIGDEVMCTFPSADAAAEASVEMQEEVAAHALQWGTMLKIRVGFHFGDVIKENNDVFGDAVNLAARMAAQAKGDQIITTGDTLEVMSPHLRMESRLLITTTVKGKTKPIQIVELTWGEEEELTVMGGPSMTIASKTTPAMAVSFNDQKLILSETQSVVSFGRGSTNTFVVPDNMSSRVHSRLEYRRGKIYLVDQSTNGTYIINSKGQQNFVHRDELPIEGSGVIGLGRIVTPDDPLAVRYSTTSG